MLHLGTLKGVVQLDACDQPQAGLQCRGLNLVSTLDWRSVLW